MIQHHLQAHPLERVRKKPYLCKELFNKANVYMKQSMLLAASLLSLAACQSPTGYVIRGSVEGAQEGDMVYLQNVENGSLWVKQDSALIKGGTFLLEGAVDAIPTARYVTYVKDGLRLTAKVYLEKGNIRLTMTPETNHVEGTTCNDVYQQFMDKFQAANKEVNEFYQQIQADTTLDEAARRAKMAELDRKDSLATEMVIQTVENNIGNVVGVDLMSMFGASLPAERMMPLLEKVPAAYQELPQLVKVKEYLKSLSRTAVGQQFVDFTLPSPEGTDVCLGDEIAKNQYTLIDFWASWCGPCRQEMPNVVEAYKAYASKGFGIVGVSLDSKADAWKKAIEDLGITWTQMSDLKGWQCEGAALYGVRAIPATVLVDQHGKIIARDLRGEELLARLAELFQ